MSADTTDLDRAAKALRSIAKQNLAVPIVEHLADHWVATSKRRAPVDTGQLKARIGIGYIGGTPARADAEVESDVPYAGFVEFGTAFHTPNPYFRAGLDAAEDLAAEVTGRVATEITRSLETGGAWNPRSLFG